jgi:LPS export ABC transporter permease LptG/LPS export ABC transporter permease LptF
LRNIVPTILDRYLVREILLPFFLWLLLLTFVLMMPPMLDNAEQLIAKGVPWLTIGQVLLTLVPQALGITIPMALLLGILIGLGRLSADREFVVLQACGVSLFRVLRPIIVLALAACAVTAYVMIIALPNANQTFRQITFNIIASKAESDIKPRVFFSQFPNRVLFVRDVEPAGGWRDVFLADDTRPGETTVYFARVGRLQVDRVKKTVELALSRGTRYTTYSTRPEENDVSSFERLALNMDAETVFPRTQVMKGDNERTIAELREKIAENQKAGQPTGIQYYTIQQKFAIPVACLVLALIGVGLGVSSRKDGKLAGFAVGIGVIFLYYVLLWTSRAGAISGVLFPSFAPWIANIVLGLAGIGLVVWRAGAADQPIRVTVPVFWQRLWSAGAARVSAPKERRERGNKVVVVVRVPHIDLPRPTLLDLYVSRQYLGIFGVSFVSLVGLFYISTFIDLADKLFRGTATSGMLLRYFYWQTPQYVYYIIPLAGLVATLVTIGLLTKNSELIVMRACGISLYRSATPLLLFAAVWSGVLFELQEHVLPRSNRHAQQLNATIRGWSVQNFGPLDRRWVVGNSGAIYNYSRFDPAVNQFTNLSIFQVDQAAWRLSSLTFARNVDLVKGPGAAEQPSLTWVARDGWNRDFTTTTRAKTIQTVVNYQAFAQRPLSLEPPKFFSTPTPDADRMTYGELNRYVTELQASGYYVINYLVQLHRKVAFPFVTIVMTLLAVPFAVTTGRRGTLYGIGIGIVMAIVYWMMLSVFGALGAGGAMSPLLAAWAPNIFFGSAAAVMLLTVRT